MQSFNPATGEAYEPTPLYVTYDSFEEWIDDAIEELAEEEAERSGEPVVGIIIDDWRKERRIDPALEEVWREEFGNS